MNAISLLSAPGKGFSESTFEVDSIERKMEELSDAGFKVLAASGISDDYLAADKLLVSEIFQAMFSHRPFPL